MISSGSAHPNREAHSGGSGVSADLVAVMTIRPEFESDDRSTISSSLQCCSGVACVGESRPTACLRIHDQAASYQPGRLQAGLPVMEVASVPLAASADSNSFSQVSIVSRSISDSKLISLRTDFPAYAVRLIRCRARSLITSSS